MYKKYKSQGLNVIAVSTRDDMEAIQKFRKELELTMPLLQNQGKKDTVSKQYGVGPTPTNYIIDKDGKVVASFIGYDEKGMKKALADLGIKL